MRLQPVNLCLRSYFVDSSQRNIVAHSRLWGGFGQGSQSKIDVKQKALAKKKGVVDVLNMAPSWRFRRGGQREILAADESIADIHLRMKDRY
jgi:hypothetical protein